MNSEISFILIACFGAACQEVLYWYELRRNLELKKHKQTLRSSKYWISLTLMIVCSGVGTWILYGDQLTIRSVQFILGAGFPIIFKNLLRNMSKGGTDLGDDFSFKDYFQL